jgi:hypothetical protein
MEINQVQAKAMIGGHVLVILQLDLPGCQEQRVSSVKSILGAVVLQ